MKYILVLFFFLFQIPFVFSADSAGNNDDAEIARAVRQAVRNADSTLLAASWLEGWRDYLKIAAMDLDMRLQPLVLIRFDEDISFRQQLRHLIERESQYQSKESEHFVFYFKWDSPVPDLLLATQDAYAQKLMELFAIKLDEKIPYLYDPMSEQSGSLALSELHGGIISNQPVNLEKSAETILETLSSELPFVTIPLAQLYGRFYQSGAEAADYFEKCLIEINNTGYLSAAELFQAQPITDLDDPAWYSAFAFTYELNETYGPTKVGEFLAAARKCLIRDDLLRSFEQVFGESLRDFEIKYLLTQSADKL